MEITALRLSADEHVLLAAFTLVVSALIYVGIVHRFRDPAERGRWLLVVGLGWYLFAAAFAVFGLRKPLLAFVIAPSLHSFQLPDRG